MARKHGDDFRVLPETRGLAIRPKARQDVGTVSMSFLAFYANFLQENYME
jgi:hypothetical protein